MHVRINKFLAMNNIASRRKVDEMIDKGRIQINGNLAQKGDVVDAASDEIKIDGKVVYGKNEKEVKFEYILLYKPEQVLSAVSDIRKRTTVTDLVETESRVYPVGRLDYLSEGLILLTNDGELAFKMTHPKHHVPKTYIVETVETFEKEQLETIRKGGIPIEGKYTSQTQIQILGSNLFQITLFEGIKRQIRVSCEYVGLTVKKLKRISIGEIMLGDLHPGESKTASKNDMEYINYIKTLE